MSLSEHELMSRLADTVRSQIAPAVDDEYARTQAFMAAVVLQRLASQAQLADAHAAAEAADVVGLADRLDTLLAQSDASPDVLAGIGNAVAQMRQQASLAVASEVIEALYRWGPDQAQAAAVLAAIRPVLRRDIDRRMEIAR